MGQASPTTRRPDVLPAALVAEESDLSRVLYVVTTTGTAHVYKDCEHLAPWLERGYVRERSFALKPGSKARLNFCTTCVCELLLEATGRLLRSE